MEIKHIDTSARGMFKAEDNGEKAGLMTYSWTGKTMFIIDHTEVDPAYSGLGVGKKMVMAAVEYARQNNLKIIPLCPFAKSVFDKTPDIRDVLYVPA